MGVSPCSFSYTGPVFVVELVFSVFSHSYCTHGCTPVKQYAAALGRLARRMLDLTQQKMGGYTAVVEARPMILAYVSSNVKADFIVPLSWA